MIKNIGKGALAMMITGSLIMAPPNIVSAAEENSIGEVSSVNKEFSRINAIDFSQSFKLGEREYVVYYYMNRCHYCNEIKDEVTDIAGKNNYKGIYRVEMTTNQNGDGWYNMKEHHNKYDKEIGELDEKGNAIYYEGESEEKYLDSEDIYYDVVKTDKEIYEKYKRLNKDAEMNKVYAVDYTPRVNLEDTSEFRVEGTPTAIRVKDGKILQCAIGGEEVVELMENFYKK